MVYAKELPIQHHAKMSDWERRHYFYSSHFYFSFKNLSSCCFEYCGGLVFQLYCSAFTGFSCHCYYPFSRRSSPLIVTEWSSANACTSTFNDWCVMISPTMVNWSAITRNGTLRTSQLSSVFTITPWD